MDGASRADGSRRGRGRRRGAAATRRRARAHRRARRRRSGERGLRAVARRRRASEAGHGGRDDPPAGRPRRRRSCSRVVEQLNADADGPRHPRADAAAEADRPRHGHPPHRPGEGRRRLSSGERRQAADRRARRLRAVHARRGAACCCGEYGVRHGGRASAWSIGRSNIVGKPMAALLVQAGRARTRPSRSATAARATSRRTRAAPTSSSPPSGRPGLVHGDMVKPGAVVIDVGMNRVEDPSTKRATRLVGDVDFDGVRAGRVAHHAGAGRRRPDDDRHAAAEHRARGAAERGADARRTRRAETARRRCSSRGAPRVDSARAACRADESASVPGASPRSAISVSTLTQTRAGHRRRRVHPAVGARRGQRTSRRTGTATGTSRCATARRRSGASCGRATSAAFPAPPDDGMQVAALGQLSVYPRRAARCSSPCSGSRPTATACGARRSSRRAARLEADGLLAPARKRAAAALSAPHRRRHEPDGAALRDIVAVLRRRAPGVELVVVPAAVQGDERADMELCAALDRVCRWGERRRGDHRPRWRLARRPLGVQRRARRARRRRVSRFPTISAVGHEVDVTLCDLVADFRAPTPSAAAEAASCRDDAEIAARRSATIGQPLVARARRRARRARESRPPAAASDARRGWSQRHVERRRASLAALAGRLNALSPLATLERGYAVARDDGRRDADVDRAVRRRHAFRSGCATATVRSPRALVRRRRERS